MRAEFDILLEDPLQTIDLELIHDAYFHMYSVLSYVPNHYILLVNKLTESTIRVHGDGRIYVRMNLASAENKETILVDLVAEFNRFLETTYLASECIFREELNFSFYGAASHSFYWKMQKELNEIGKDVLGNFNIRTFTFDEDSIHIKLEQVNVFNSIETPSNMIFSV